MTGQSARSKHFVMLLSAWGAHLDTKYQQRESTLGHPPGREVVKQLVANLFDEHSCPLVVKFCYIQLLHIAHLLVKHTHKKKKKIIKYLFPHIYSRLLVSEFREFFVFLQLFPAPDEILRDALISGLKSPYIQFSQIYFMWT